MPAFGSAEFVIRAINKTQQTFTQINSGVDNMDRRFKKLGGGLNRLGGLFATAFVGRQITDTITKFEKLEASLRTVTGSADKASVAFGFIENFAATTPFQLEEVVDAFIKLKALGLTPSEEALTSYGNTATAMGKSLNQMIEAVADATTGEFERLKEFGIKSRAQGDQVTFTFQGVSTTVGKNAKEIEGYLRSIGDVQFAGAMKEQAGTLNVALSNMGDAFSKLVKAIGDAGLTDILIFIADKVKWLAQLITDSIEPFRLGFKAFIAEVIKFGNLFIAVFEGVGDAFNAFGDAISSRFEALGKDLAAFVENPLGGISFENTRAALETGLLDAMGTAFDKALARAQEFNSAIDAEIQDAAAKIVEARAAKNQSLDGLFGETATPEKVEETAKAVKGLNKMQQEAKRIFEATRTPLERYNEEMAQLNMLLEKGYINQDTFGRAVEQAGEKLGKSTKKTGETIEGEFARIGESMEGTIADSLDAIGGRFDGFGDFFKGFLSDLNRTLLQYALKDLGISGKGGIIDGLFSSIGGMFGGGIWATDIKEVRSEKTTTQTSSGGGKGGGGGKTTTSQTTISYEYFVTLAIAICEGEIDEVIRVWADSKVLTEAELSAAQGKYNVHYGTEDQGVDDIMAKYLPAGAIPAHRGMAYVVIEDFPLAAYGNRIPNFTFEVRHTVKFQPSVEDKVKDIVIIPGAGEFVYSTQVTTKQDGYYAASVFTPSGDKTSINMHNYDGKADVQVAIDQLLKVLPNLEWVAVVVTWFATSTDAGDCEIIPKVEFHGTTQVLPQDWNVAGIDRASAELVLFFDADSPTYGGTPSDHTVVQFVDELKSRGLNVMFYPMVFVDTITPEAKPWRGRIAPANATDAASWFTKTNGYNAFIAHYASLLDGKVDAFVIGSELIGMTGYTDSPGSYPAVDELVSLAATVKTIMGAGTLLTYAADWSEYHSLGGWFNLDPLWASSNIDFVGIDSYFPITPDLPQSQIDQEKIKEYWEKGEGWDYYYTDSVARTGQTSYGGNPAYAWKNLEYWWKNTHTNPDSNVTGWTSKMKPVWFTEFGFPSVDGCTNQPNVFYDPTSSESFFPRGSKGRTDFQAQRVALDATLDYLEARETASGNTGLVARRFIWTWDARPFSFWPDLEGVWQDSILWASGHWVNGKLGASTLGAVVAELLQAAGLTPSDYDVTRLTASLEGFILQQPITVRNALEQLASGFFFDVVESDGILKCVPRGNASVKSIPEDDLIPSVKNGVQDVLEINYAQELELPQRVNVTYIDRPFNYDPVTQTSQRQTTKAVDQVTINLPIVMGATQAKQVADITLYGTWKERLSFGLTLPPKYVRIEPTDVITVTVSGVAHEMRVIKTDMEANGLMKISAVAEDVSSYDFYTPPGETSRNITPPVLVPDTLLQFVDAPPLPTDTVPNQGLLRLGVAPDGADWNGAAIYRSDDGGEDGGNTFNLLAGLEGAATFGAIITDLPAGITETWDQVNQVEVVLTAGSLASVSELAVLNGANAALIGDELVQFQNAELIGERTYRLSRLLRGRQGTEWAVGSHTAGDRFILLSPALYTTAIANNLIGRELFYKAVSVGNSLGNTDEITFTYTGRNLKPFAPVHLTGLRDGSGNLTISWVRRSRVDAEWRDGVGIPLGEESEAYEVDILDGSTVVRTIETTNPTASYSAADQTADFGSAQSSVDVRIYQLSAIVGRGYGASATV